ncbi:MAG: L,D-transpeptidase [Bdellovibrionales bacterium]
MNLGKLKLTIYMTAAMTMTSAHAEGERVATSVSSNTATSVVTPAAQPKPKFKESRIGKDNGQIPEVNNWLKKFDLVVVIDKKDQSLVAYRNGNPRDATPTAQPVLKTKVSTGAELSECNPQKDTVPDSNGVFWYKGEFKKDPDKVGTAARHTPTGYFVPAEVDANHYSGEFGSKMTNAVKFIDELGIWTHEFPPGTEKMLGSKDSHGCVRMGKVEAEKLFNMVLMTGGQFDPKTDAGLRARCPAKRFNPSCVPSAKTNADLEQRFSKMAQGNFTVATDAKHPYDMTGVLPRLSVNAGRGTTEVPMLNTDGTPVLDSTGAARTTQGYKTLYIVKDSNLGTDQETPPATPKTCPTVSEYNASLAEKLRTTAPASSASTQTAAPSHADLFDNSLSRAFKNVFNPNVPAPVPETQARRASAPR